MATGTIYHYNSFWVDVLSASIDMSNGGDTIKVALCSSSYTPDRDAHDFFDDITNEVTGTGYTAGGATLANQAVTQDNTNDRAIFSGDDVTWSTATVTFRYAIIYKSTGAAATSPLIAYIDFGADQVYSAQNITIDWNATGIFGAGGT